MGPLFAANPPDLPPPIAVIPPGHEPAETARRAAEWNSSLRPFDATDLWLAERCGYHAIELDQLMLAKAARRKVRAKRAELCWDADRRAEAEDVAARLGEAPSATVAKLRRTYHGLLWLVGRWTSLRRGRDAGPWSRDQRRVALDLLGVPPTDRRPTPLGTGPADPPPDDQARLADDQIALLEREAAALGELDELERQVAREGLDHDSSPEGRDLRRGERAIERDLHWCLAHMRDQGGRGGRRPPLRPTDGPRDAPPSPPPPPPPRPERPEPGPLLSAARSAFSPAPRNRAERRALDRLLRQSA